MKRSLYSVSAGLALLLAFSVNAVFAQAATPGKVTLNLSDLPLKQVIQALVAQEPDISVVFVDRMGGIADRRVVFVKIQNRTVEQALRIICKAAGVALEEEDGVYYIKEFTEPEGRIPPKVLWTDQGPRRPATPPDLPPDLREPPILEKVVLQFLHPTVVLQMLNYSHTEDLKAPYGQITADEIRPGLIDPLTGGWYYPLQSAPAMGTINPSGPRMLRGGTGAYQFGGGGFGGGGFGGGGGGFGGGGGGFGGGGFGGGGFGGGGLGGGGFGGGGLGGGGGFNLVPDGIEGVLGYPLDNSLLVSGTPEAIQELKNIIRLLDIPPRQISIRVEQIAVQTTFRQSFGLDWSILNNDVQITTAVGLSSGGSITVVALGNNWRATMAAFISSGKATVIDSQQITTMNNVPASISSISISFVFLPIQSQIQGAGLLTQFVPVPVIVPTTLFATPRVNGDGTITMFIPFIISRTIGESVGPNGERIPNQVQTQLFALRRVASGQTIVVGGITNRSESTSTSGIPILKDLPLIGSLFRSRLESKDNNESLFFFTPTLLPEAVGTGGEPDLGVL